MKILEKSVAKEVKAVVAGIEKFQKDIQKTAEEFKLHTKLLDDQKNLEKAIISTGEKLQTLGEERSQLLDERKKRKEILRELLQKKMALKQSYDGIISAFSENADEILNDLIFSADLHFREEAFSEGCSRLFDERSVTVKTTSDKTSDFAVLLSVAVELEGKGDPKLVDKYVDAVDTILSTLQAKVRKAVTSKMMCDHLYNDFWSVVPSVKYKRVSLAKLSLGQKATVLIKIYLAQGDKPIIIDSHDDHLDNEFIMDELVMAIRKAKKYRQVIIVSNNGNMVVNSDAEQVVIASRDDKGEISYASGSLENPALRTRLLRVLEGGETAFSKRQQKYRLQS